MAQTTQVVQTKMLDYFFSLRDAPRCRVPADRRARDRRAARVRVPVPPGDADAAAVDRLGRARGHRHRALASSSTCSSSRHDPRAGRADSRPSAAKPARPAAPVRDQPDPGQPARPGVRGRRRSPTHGPRRGPRPPRRSPSSAPNSSPSPDVGALQRQVKALRRLGFGFAVDDAGAGYASFALIAALRPTRHQDRPRDRRTASAATTRSRRWSRRSCRSAGASARKLLAEGIETARRPCRAARARRRLRAGLPPRPARARADEAARSSTRSSAGAKGEPTTPARARVPSRA